MTEDKAKTKTKWCPNMGRADTCIASACMAWRWERWSEVERVPGAGGGQIVTYEPTGERTSGFCGLAGAPQ